MPIVEIDENELLAYKRMAGVANKIMANPQGKKLLEQAHKLVDPGAITPTLDLEAQLEAARKEDREQIAALKAQMQADKEEREKNATLASLQATIDKGFAELRSQGWQEDGIKKVDEVMKEKNILDPLLAAAWVEKNLPQPTTATPSGGTSWNFMDSVTDTDADLKSLIANRGEGNTADKMAADALREFRGNNQRR